jgi:hypothetical protein
MKFLSNEDAKLFLIEIGRLDILDSVTTEFEPTTEMLEVYSGRRESLVRKLKDHRKGQNTKAQWRGNRHKMMRGIKAYHKSTEGKRFHRKLGNHLANRLFKREDFSGVVEKSDYLKSLSSAKTHFFIELQYYHTLSEQIEIEELALDYSAPIFNSIELKIINDEDLTDDEETFLYDITEEASIIRAVADISSSTIEAVSGVWNASKVESLNSNENEVEFPLNLINGLKASFNLT